MLAYDYPIMGAFFTMLWFFLWILWIMLLFRIIGDIFRSHDMSGWGKAGWLVLVLLVPFLGVFIYVIARGHEMGRRDMEAARAQDDAFRSYVRDAAAPSNGTAGELSALAALKDNGTITEAEFQQQKAKILA
jgi:hypothetical protein